MLLARFAPLAIWPRKRGAPLGGFIDQVLGRRPSINRPAVRRVSRQIAKGANRAQQHQGRFSARARSVVASRTSGRRRQQVTQLVRRLRQAALRWVAFSGRC